MGALLRVQVPPQVDQDERSAQVVEKLRPYWLGWKAYFAMAQTPRVWRELDEWLRHRLRAIQLRHWKRPKTIYRELKAMGPVKMWPSRWEVTAIDGGATATV